jgi:hypothetical protein
MTELMVARRVVRAQPRGVMRLKLPEQLSLHPQRRRRMEQQRPLVKGVGGPPRVLLTEAIAAEPEARVVVDDPRVAQPATLHDVVAGGAHDRVVRPAPKHLLQELG